MLYESQVILDYLVDKLGSPKHDLAGETSTAVLQQSVACSQVKGGSLLRLAQECGS